VSLDIVPDIELGVSEAGMSFLFCFLVVFFVDISKKKSIKTEKAKEIKRPTID
jgi:hypothetical protein